ARTNLEPVKQQFLQQLMSEEKENNKDVKTEKTDKKVEAPKPTDKAKMEAQALKQAERLRKEKQNRIERSISTMFRIMSNNHVNLSHMADSKANIMISVNTIV